ncbi:MAG: hypothetical protein AMXMBFR84_01580 [Candidatus Hydrogenedentota bacterium]
MVKGIAGIGVVALVVAMGLAGCASSGGMMNKATFGLVGEDDPNAEAEKEQRKAEKRAAEQAKKEEKQARKAEKQAAKEQEGGRSLTNRMTFGLVGEDDAAAKEQKQAEKEAKQQAEREREAEKRAQKQARKEEKKQAEAEKKAQKQAAKQAETHEPAASADTESQEDAPKRGLMSKATFGLVGGKDPAEQEAKEQRKAEKKAAEEARKEEKRAAKEAKREEKQAAKAETESTDESATEEDKPKRSMLSKATFGLLGDGKDEEAPAAEMEPATESSAAQESTEPVATPESTEPVATPESTEPAAEGESAEPAEGEAAEEDAPKRPLLSRMTFGLAGGDEEDWKAREETEAQHQARQGAINALPRDAKKLGEGKFESSLVYEPNSAGRTMGIANRVTYSKHGYGITDLGNIRIAVEGMTFDGVWKSGGLVVDSTERGALSGSSGSGNRKFAYEYVNGTTTFTFGSVSFTVTQGMLDIGGQTASVKEGRKLVIVSQSGAVQGIYDIGP